MGEKRYNAYKKQKDERLTSVLVLVAGELNDRGSQG
jgi:hypothetical protein